MFRITIEHKIKNHLNILLHAKNFVYQFLLKSSMVHAWNFFKPHLPNKSGSALK